METQIFTRQSGLETSEYVERRLGRTSDFARGTSVHDGQTTESESEQAVPLLSPQEIAELPETDILCVHRNLKPFRARRMDWREYKVLERFARIPSPRLQTLPAPAQIMPLPATKGPSRVDFVDIDQLQRKQRPVFSQRTKAKKAREK
jgi:type IV secretory pathway TraG/TraD family ATPase VirD4